MSPEWMASIFFGVFREMDGDNQRPLLFPFGFCIAFSPRLVGIRPPDGSSAP